MRSLANNPVERTRDRASVVNRTRFAARAGFSASAPPDLPARVRQFRTA